MKVKKSIVIIVIILLVISAVMFGIYNFMTSYLFNKDGTIVNDHEKVINAIKSIEDAEERKEQVDLLVKEDFLTQEEANELY